ncbi:MAG: c-type cytochrome [Cytophagales bacterium]|nr:c-type cytochrome [Cytophagales bacterium]
MFTHHAIFKTVVPLCLAGWLGLSYFSRDEARTPAPTPVPAAGNPKTDKLKLPGGFKAEHLYSPSENGQGSWVSMTFDPKGRMITSDQYGSLYRIQLPAAGSGGKPKVEKLAVGPPPAPGDTSKKIGMGYAQGLLYAFNSLYVMVNHRGNSPQFEKSSGLYRLQDTDGNDTYDKVTLLKQLVGEGEHGPHNIVLAPDGKSLYVMAGNFTDVPKMDAYRVPPVWNEDNIFPFIPDPRGHATDRKAPGGWIANVDSTGQRWEYFGGGFRNTYDMAFNEAGDLFCFDSDMEWDFGMPWYKPTRVLHITSGAEFGWRSSSINWSPGFADNLPAVLNVGQGSPTGVFHGRNARFPDKYKKALYVFDWSFGIIYAVHLQPQGASYTATAEEFVAGAPLPLTDGLIGPDGALYFLTGGRRLESDLYRVSYGDQANAPAPVASNAPAPAVNDANQLRRSLEAYHGGPKKGAVDAAWPHLKHEDRFIRHAARVAVENQPVAEWQERALKETDPRTLTTAVIALARHAQPDAKDPMLGALTKVNYASLPETAQLDLLRALELVMYRTGKPEGAARESVIAFLSPHYPAKTNALNRSLSKVLHYLDAPGAVEKTMVLLRTAKDEPAEQTVSASSNLIMRNPQYGLDIAKMLSNVPPAQQTYYATVLSQAKAGWTPALQEEYMKWFAKAFTYKGGHSYIGFIDKMRKQALANAPQEKFDAYNKLSGAELLTSSGNDLVGVPQPKGPGKPWKVETALPVVEGALVSRNFEQGKNMFAATLCLSCHAMKGEGGSIGPDLTRLGTRFSNKDILTHIIEPNKEVSDQYAATVFTLKDGSSVVGRLVREDKDKYYVSQNPFAPDMLEELPRKNVTATKLSKVSLMLPGLINRLNDEELRDLMAYLVSGANPQHEAYKAGKAAPATPAGGGTGKSK